VNDVLERMRREVVVAYYKELEEISKTTKNLVHNSRSPG
jgi:hypothetical protein